MTEGVAISVAASPAVSGAAFVLFVAVVTSFGAGALLVAGAAFVFASATTGEDSVIGVGVISVGAGAPLVAGAAFVSVFTGVESVVTVSPAVLVPCLFVIVIGIGVVSIVSGSPVVLGSRLVVSGTTTGAGAATVTGGAVLSLDVEIIGAGSPYFTGFAVVTDA